MLTLRQMVKMNFTNKKRSKIKMLYLLLLNLFSHELETYFIYNLLNAYGVLDSVLKIDIHHLIQFSSNPLPLVSLLSPL